jgi:hypothetical protein
MRIIFYCVASQDYVKKYNKCINSQQAYCIKNNYKYILDTNEDRIVTKKDWYWKKIEGLPYLFKEADAIVLIDADCTIKDNCPPIESVLSEKSIYYVLGISNRPNSGFLIIKSNETGSNFINEVLKRRYIPSPEIHKSKGENGVVIWVLSEMDDKHELPLKWNCSQPNFINDAYIIHYTNMMREFYK